MCVRRAFVRGRMFAYVLRTHARMPAQDPWRVRVYVNRQRAHRRPVAHTWNCVSSVRNDDGVDDTFQGARAQTSLWFVQTLASTLAETEAVCVCVRVRFEQNASSAVEHGNGIIREPYVLGRVHGVRINVSAGVAAAADVDNGSAQSGSGHSWGRG